MSNVVNYLQSHKIYTLLILFFLYTIKLIFREYDGFDVSIKIKIKIKIKIIELKI